MDVVPKDVWFTRDLLRHLVVFTQHTQQKIIRSSLPAGEPVTGGMASVTHRGLRSPHTGLAVTVG